MISQHFGGGKFVKKPGKPRLEWELHCILKGVMIRRLKKDVLTQLPDKIRQSVKMDEDKIDPKIIKQIAKKQAAMKEVEKYVDRTAADEGKASEDDFPQRSEVMELFRLTADAKAAACAEYV